jgi:hypothetical protein
MAVFLNILGVRRGIVASCNATNGTHVRKPRFEHFGQEQLGQVVDGTIAIDGLTTVLRHSRMRPYGQQFCIAVMRGRRSLLG